MYNIFQFCNKSFYLSSLKILSQRVPRSKYLLYSGEIKWWPTVASLFDTRTLLLAQSDCSRPQASSWVRTHQRKSISSSNCDPRPMSTFFPAITGIVRNKKKNDKRPLVYLLSGSIGWRHVTTATAQSNPASSWPDLRFFYLYHCETCSRTC